MKRKILATIVTAGTILSGCSGGKSSGSSSAGSILSGVAAVGAPISNGVVEVKGANGIVVSTTTNSNGVYGVGLGALASPYLVRVTSPTGQKYFTVASKEDVSASKKINITPITHTIVANVFNEKSPDTLFDNFTTKSNDYSVSAVNVAKEDFKQKMIAAGVIGSGGILTDTNVDLMNGSFVAGSGAGVDRLLDALEIDVEKGASDIEVNLKGGVHIYSNNVADPTQSGAVASVVASINTVNSQLGLLDDIKVTLNNINRIYKTTVACAGPAVTTGSCSKTVLHDRILGSLHSDYSWGGLNGDTDSWAFFCAVDKVNGDLEASSASSCNFINSVTPTFSDVVVLELNDAKNEATIQYSSYHDGVYSDTEIEKVALEADTGDINQNEDTTDLVWKIKGNQHSHNYWFQPFSVHKTVYNSSTPVQSYEAQIQLYINGLNASLGTNVSLRAINKNGSENTALNTALNGDATNGLALTSDMNGNANTLYITANKYRDYVTGAVVPDTCGTCTENFDANKINLSEAALGYMDAVQKFELRYTNSGAKSEIIYIRRPMKITANNAASLAPNFSSPDLCGGVKASYSITKPVGQVFDYGSIYLYDGVSNIALTGGGSAEDQTSIQINNADDYLGEALNYASFYLSSEDNVGRKFSRVIECK